ncbi:hypothetical protein X752_04630 [Mesorhizobium sp. LNJC398B00]|nr:hypothetical protein X752_04630 [Mesorhizobium sp. LNJC398B00]
MSERCPHRVERQGEAVGGRGFRQRALDELRLPTLPVRRQHDVPCQPQRYLCAIAGAHNVQAAIEPGGDAGRGDDVAVVDIEHIGVDGDIGMKRLQLVRIGPVRGRFPARKQAGGGKGKSA